MNKVETARNKLKDMLDWSDRLGSDEIFEISDIICILNEELK